MNIRHFTLSMRSVPISHTPILIDIPRKNPTMLAVSDTTPFTYPISSLLALELQTHMTMYQDYILRFCEIFEIVSLGLHTPCT